MHPLGEWNAVIVAPDTVNCLQLCIVLILLKLYEFLKIISPKTRKTCFKTDAGLDNDITKPLCAISEITIATGMELRACVSDCSVNENTVAIAINRFNWASDWAKQQKKEMFVSHFHRNEIFVVIAHRPAPIKIFSCQKQLLSPDPVVGSQHRRHTNWMPSHLTTHGYIVSSRNANAIVFLRLSSPLILFSFGNSEKSNSIQTGMIGRPTNGRRWRGKMSR